MATNNIQPGSSAGAAPSSSGQGAASNTPTGDAAPFNPLSQKGSSNPQTTSTTDSQQMSGLPDAFRQQTQGKLTAPMDQAFNKTIEKRLGVIKQQYGWLESGDFGAPSSRSLGESSLSNQVLAKIDGNDAGKILPENRPLPAMLPSRPTSTRPDRNSGNDDPRTERAKEIASALSGAESLLGSANSKLLSDEGSGAASAARKGDDPEEEGAIQAVGDTSGAMSGLNTGAQPLAAAATGAAAKPEGPDVQKTIDMINTLVSRITTSSAVGQTNVQMQLKEANLPPALQGATLTVTRTDQGGISVKIENAPDEATAAKLIRDNVSQLALGLRDKGVQLTDIVVGTTNVRVPDALKEGVFSGFLPPRAAETPTNVSTGQGQQPGEQERRQQQDDQQGRQKKEGEPAEEGEDELQQP